MSPKHKRQQVSEQIAQGRVVGIRPAESPIFLSVLLQSQSAVHLPSLRDCHLYAISEAGARRPLPISPPPCTLLFTPAPPYFPHPPCQSSLKGPDGILPWLPHEDRTEDKEMHRKKKALKRRIQSLLHASWSPLSFLCSHGSCCCCCCGCLFPSLLFYG